MSPLLTAWKPVVFCGLAAGFLATASAQVFDFQGVESPVSGEMQGDQVFPALCLCPEGGYAVWQDSKIDGRGQGVAAIKLDSALQPTGEPFVINQRRPGHQERPSVAMLTGGGAAFLWHGPNHSSPDLYTRFSGPDGSFLTGDILVNPPLRLVKSNHYEQIYGYQNNKLRNLRFKMTDSAKVYRDRNQDATVAALPNGDALVVSSGWRRLHTNWSEIVRVEKWSRGRYITNDLPKKFGASQDWMLDVFFQRFSADGKKIGSEMLVNQFAKYNQRNPSVAVLPSGDFVVVWVSENYVVNIPPVRIPQGPASGTQVDIMARLFNADGTPLGNEFRVNTAFRTCSTPAVSAMSDGRFTVVWAGRDGVRANGLDIFARVFSDSGAPQSEAFRLNEHTYGDQFAPRIGSVGANQFVVWSSLGQDKTQQYLTRVDQDGSLVSVPTGLSGSVQAVYGRRLSEGAPVEAEIRVSTNFVKRLHPEIAADPSGRFLATWSRFSVESGFDLYCRSFITTPAPDGANNVAARQGAAGVNDGTGGANGTGGGSTGAGSVGGTSGASGWRASLTGPPSKLRLNWSTEAGARYQVQISSDLRHWVDLGAPRSGSGAVDSVGVEPSGSAGFLRVLKLP